MTKTEMIEKLNNAPGKNFVSDGYFYGYAIIETKDGTETTAIIKRPANCNYRDLYKLTEVVYYTPEVKV